MTEYYVSPNGNNTNNGLTPQMPWQTPSYAVQQVIAGDTINLMDGTWYKENITFISSGTEFQPITLKAYSGNLSMPLLDGQDRVTTNYRCIHFNRQSYINVIGIKIYRYYSPLFMEGSNHIYVSDCEVKEFSGIHLSRPYNLTIGSSYNTLNNCLIEDASWNALQLVGREYPDWAPSSEGHHIYITNNRIINSPLAHAGGIDIMGTMRDIFIIGNYFENNDGGAAYTHALFVEPVWRVTISNNTFINTGKANLQGIRNAIVENNIFQDLKQEAISPGGYGTPIGTNYDFVPHDATIRNNTFINIANYPVIYIGRNAMYENNNMNNITGTSYQLRGESDTYIIKDQIDNVFKVMLRVGGTIEIKYTGNKSFLATATSGSANISTPTYNGIETVSTITATGTSGSYSTIRIEQGGVTPPDTTPPSIVSVTSLSSTQVKVVYSEPVDQSSATNITNYYIDNNISIYSSSISTDLKTVTLTTSSHIINTTYTITVNNVKDTASPQNTIVPNTQKTYQYIESMLSNIIVASGKTYLIDYISTGKVQYIDRTFTFTSVPLTYQNNIYIITANDDKAYTTNPFLEFDVTTDVIVYVAHDDRITTKPSWLSLYTDTGENITSDGGTFSLYAKNFLAGHITLGGNEGGSNSMYTVIISEQTTIPCPKITCSMQVT